MTQIEDAMAPRSSPRREELLLEALDALAAFPLLPSEQQRLVIEAAAKLREQVVYVVVLGDFKRGKSTLINALLDAPILPTGVVPVTAVSTLIRRGEHARVLARGSGGEEELALEELPKLVTEKGNPGNHLELREVIVEYPTTALPEGLVLVDTPGLGSRYAHNTAMTRSFLPRVDAALVVLTADSPLSEAEGQLLAEVAAIAPAVAVCLNKVDQLDSTHLYEAEEFVRAGVTEIVTDRPVPLYLTAARRHFELPPGEDGLPGVLSWIKDRVVGDRSTILQQRALHVARSGHRLASSTLRLERAALLQPAKTAVERRTDFEAERAALYLDARGAVSHLMDAVREISNRVVDPAADLLREQLPPRLLAAADEAWPDEVRASAQNWQREIELQCAKELRVVPARHLERLQHRMDGFIAKTGQLFDVSLPEPFQLETTLELPPVRMTMVDEPGALAMSIRGLRRLLPGPVGSWWRVRARHRRAYDDADRLAGRLRYAAVRAVDQAARQWVEAIEAGWQSLADALSRAIERSTAAIIEGEAAVARQREHLSGLEEQLAAIAVTVDSFHPPVPQQTDAAAGARAMVERPPRNRQPRPPEWEARRLPER